MLCAGPCAIGEVGDKREEAEREGSEDRGGRGGCARFPDSLRRREISMNLCLVNEFNLIARKKSLKVFRDVV